MTVAFRVPEELSARVPAELRAPGRDRDAVRLLVSRGAEAYREYCERLCQADAIRTELPLTEAARG